MASRENADIWWSLIGRYPGGRWRITRLFTKNFWTNSYLWQDSFLTYWNRAIGCRVFGHRNVITIQDEYNNEVQHCFACYRRVGGWFIHNCMHCKLVSSWPLEKKGLYLECPHCGIKTIISRSR